MKIVRVYRHPDCARCARYARRHRRLDWLDRVEVSTRTPSGHRPLRLGEVVFEDLRDGRLLQGAEGFALLCRQVPAYWPLLALLPISAVRRSVERDLAGDCDGGACAIPDGEHER